MNRQLAFSIVLMFALPLGAQTTSGYSPQSAIAERAAEADVITRPSPMIASAHSKFLSLQPHMAGTPAQARTRDYVVSQMKSWGLETEVLPQSDRTESAGGSDSRGHDVGFVSADNALQRVRGSR